MRAIEHTEEQKAYIRERLDKIRELEDEINTYKRGGRTQDKD